MLGTHNSRASAQPARHTSKTCFLRAVEPARRRVVAAHAAGHGGTDEQQARRMVLLRQLVDLLPQSRRQLRAAAAAEPDALSAPFLFWLRDIELQLKRGQPKAAGSQQQPTQEGVSEGQHEGAGISQQVPMLAGGMAGNKESVGSPWLVGPHGIQAPPPPAAAAAAGRQPQALPQVVPASEAAAHSTTALPAARQSEPRDLDGLTAEQVAEVAAELVALREWQETEGAKRLLPALASSLAYGNLQRWRQETGAGPGAVKVPGAPTVRLEELYRLGEAEERKLMEGGSSSIWGPATSSGTGRAGASFAHPRTTTSGSPTTGQGGTSGRRARSTLDDFASRDSVLAGVAAGAMARVRARLFGFEDGAQAAADVLDVLLHATSDRGERATLLHDAFTPPGLVYDLGSMPSASQAPPSGPPAQPSALDSAPSYPGGFQPSPAPSQTGARSQPASAPSSSSTFFRGTLAPSQQANSSSGSFAEQLGAYRRLSKPAGDPAANMGLGAGVSRGSVSSRPAADGATIRGGAIEGSGASNRSNAEVQSTASLSTASSQQAPRRVVTTPDALLREIESRMHKAAAQAAGQDQGQLQQGTHLGGLTLNHNSSSSSEGGRGAGDGGIGPSDPSLAAAGGPGLQAGQAGGGPAVGLIDSGHGTGASGVPDGAGAFGGGDLIQALTELQEDVREYEEHVWRYRDSVA